MLTEIKDKYAALFLITEIIGEEHIKSWRRTAFSWTPLPSSVCLAANKHYFKQALANDNIIGIIARPQAVLQQSEKLNKAVIITDKAADFFYFLHNKAIHSKHRPASSLQQFHIHPSAKIASTAIIGQRVSIGANSVVHEGCILEDDTSIGTECTIFPCVTLGTQGFFSKMISGRKTHVQHFGGVKIGNNCIIHTGSNVSRSVNWGENTELADHVHVGINSNIGHDCKIGTNCDISAKVMLAGRVVIGKDCWIGASATVSNAIKVGDEVEIKIGSVVIRDIATKQTVSGNFAKSHSKNLKHFLKT